MLIREQLCGGVLQYCVLYRQTKVVRQRSGRHFCGADWPIMCRLLRMVYVRKST